jgi:SAM-dependent methyltransferase
VVAKVLALREPSTAAVLDLAERGAALIQEAATVAEANVLRAQASAIEDLTRTMQLTAEAKQAAKLLRLRCERRIGELLREGQANGSIATKGAAGRGRQMSTATTSIDDLGLTRDESATFQRLAEVDADEFDAIVATKTKVGPITRAAVLEGIEEATDSRRVPTGVRHPAPYSSGLLPVFVELLEGFDRVLDPFAGTGRVHELDGHDTVGVELEPEWAALHPRTIVGNALALPFDDQSFDAVVTSPTYGNRFADHHEARDGSERRSYTHDLGRTLHADNSGAMQWGAQYRDVHERAWLEVVRVLRPGGRFVLNISDHYRGGRRQPVSAWHVDTVLRLGLRLVDIVPVPTARMRHGDNAERVVVEYVFAFGRDES